jgi:hypothetical protein
MIRVAPATRGTSTEMMMRTYTKTVREGEKVGEVDWSYNFRQHFNNYCMNEEGRDEICAKVVQRFREIVDLHAAGKRVFATTDDGCPKFGFNEVLYVGMYDGWPYWSPVPSVLTYGTLGPEWHSFCSLTDYFAENANGEKHAGDE